ncbi:hypothetical protein [Trinickia fusca]|uniref:Uncharacterized protein n=1 Tax=Trinickia fusca TaxID=2419777 RepID=A0A494X9Y7_9BURK|nr:hypothetical protein [Trinickia fusca]RKP47545.1 hypothetical protein D7S89_15060 [Trinickia fusca]
MTQKPSGKGPILALDLEKFRVKYGLSISSACEIFGLQRAKWTALQKTPSAVLTDNTVCILLDFYERNPGTIPIRRIINIRQHMVDLGYDPDNPTDKALFATTHGREKAASYRWDGGQGGISKPVERLIEATDRLPTESGRKKRQILESIAREVAARQGIRDPLSRGSWRKDD